MIDAAASTDPLPPLREVIDRYELRAKKSLGQNFLLDLNITRKIARLAGDLENQRVIEVGPGPGGLTRALLMEGAVSVAVIERDDRCLPALDDIARAYSGRLDIHSGDALETDWQSLAGGAPRVTVAANLPYGIATLLLTGWLEAEPWPPWYQRLVLMFQHEVAERIVATPGTKAYGRLSVIAQWRTEPRIALTLPPEAFTPPPKVKSSVVVLTPRTSPSPPCSAASLARVTAAAFGQRRKMLRQSLKALTAMPELLLNEAGIDPQRRAETLSPQEFGTIALIIDRSAGARS